MDVLLGKMKVPAIGLGTWHMGDDPTKKAQEIEALQTGIEAGARVIDTAEMYGEGRSERLVGEAIKPYEREELYLISKFYPWNAGKNKIESTLRDSLERLQTDYLDLYLLHWRGKIPLVETVTELERLKSSGLIRNWGVSNFDTRDMRELFGVKNGRNCATDEVLYNLSSRGIDFDLKPWLREHHMPLIAYSPIAQGDSLGANLSQNTILRQIAQQHQASLFQILLAWAIRDGKTIAIPQSSKKSHVLDNLAAGKIQLSPAEYAQLDQVFPKPVSKQSLDVL